MNLLNMLGISIILHGLLGLTRAMVRYFTCSCAAAQINSLTITSTFFAYKCTHADHKMATLQALAIGLFYCSAVAYQTYCAFCDKSTKFGIHVGD